MNIEDRTATIFLLISYTSLPLSLKPHYLHIFEVNKHNPSNSAKRDKQLVILYLNKALNGYSYPQ